jgi:hypothetical protein
VIENVPQQIEVLLHKISRATRCGQGRGPSSRLRALARNRAHLSLVGSES